jgi:hypothetical protein|tara:strand:+ start:834 stop:1121 length:288 start_codon:yes stop_codon:yes gene_type:complete
MKKSVSKRERVPSGHRFIGKYMIRVTNGMDRERANWWCGRANQMVERRGEDCSTFIVLRLTFGKKPKFCVMRKVFAGDPMEFLERTSRLRLLLPT